MRIAGTLSCSLVNGAGVRYVIFTQGCYHNCKGCQNPDTHDPNGGYEVTVDELVEDIKSHKHIDGITLSGGDPFLQQDECIDLIEKLSPINVWCYTGFTFEDLFSIQFGDVMYNLLLDYIDVLVDGKFEENLKSDCKFRGSSNQRIIDVKKSLKEKEVVLYME